MENDIFKSVLVASMDRGLVLIVVQEKQAEILDSGH